MSLYRDSGVVLRTYRLGEADRIIVLLTQENGKVRAVAKGVRKTMSKFGASLEPLSHVNLMLWRGKGDLDTISQVEVLDAHLSLRSDLQRVAPGLSILEVADQYCQDGHRDPAIFDMVIGALRVLDDQARPIQMVAPSFFLKLLALDGAEPVLDQCVLCGNDESLAPLVAFSMAEGGALCGACRRGRPMSAGALLCVRKILQGGLAAVLSEPPPPCGAEIADLAIEAIEFHLDRRLKTVRSVSGF